MSNRERLPGLTIRAALLLGFGVTLAVWVVSGYSVSRRMSEVQREAAAINARYMHAQELLSTVRAQVLLGSVYVRDALLDPNPGATGEYRRHIEDAFASAPPDRLLTIRVGTRRPSAAQYRLRGQTDIDRLLEVLLELRETR